MGTSLLAVDARDVGGQRCARSLRSRGLRSTARFRTRSSSASQPSGPSPSCVASDSAWLVTGAGKIIREIETGTERGFPRLWLTRSTTVRIGGSLPASLTAATRALAAARDVRLPRRVKGVRLEGGQLTLVLRRGPEIRLGEAADVLLKLTVAARVFPLLGDETRSTWT